MSNLIIRISTSFLLVFILSISLFINKYLFLTLLIISSFISFHEFNNLIKKTIKNNKKLIKTVQILSIFFFNFIYIY